MAVNVRNVKIRHAKEMDNPMLVIILNIFWWITGIFVKQSIITLRKYSQLAAFYSFNTLYRVIIELKQDRKACEMIRNTFDGCAVEYFCYYSVILPTFNTNRNHQIKVLTLKTKVSIIMG